MSKIKDNIDLKELEKYGFAYGIVYPLGEAYCKPLEDNDFIFITLDKNIFFEFEDYSGDNYKEYCKSLIKDLINDGLVEEGE